MKHYFWVAHTRQIQAELRSVSDFRINQPLSPASCLALSPSCPCEEKAPNEKEKRFCTRVLARETEHCFIASLINGDSFICSGRLAASAPQFANLFANNKLIEWRIFKCVCVHSQSQRATLHQRAFLYPNTRCNLLLRRGPSSFPYFSPAIVPRRRHVLRWFDNWKTDKTVHLTTSTVIETSPVRCEQEEKNVFAPA